MIVNKTLLHLNSWVTGPWLRHYKRYSGLKSVSDMETVAQRNKVGLWASQGPIAPWIYQRIHGHH